MTARMRLKRSIALCSNIIIIIIMIMSPGYNEGFGGGERPD